MLASFAFQIYTPSHGALAQFAIDDKNARLALQSRVQAPGLHEAVSPPPLAIEQRLHVDLIS